MWRRFVKKCGGWGVVAYCGFTTVLWLVFFGLGVWAQRDPHHPKILDAKNVGELLAPIWPPTSDPILNVICGVLGVGLVLLLAPGLIWSGVVLAALSLALLLGTVVIGGIVLGLGALASASPTGAVLVVGLLLSLLSWAVWTFWKKYRLQLARALDLLLYGLREAWLFVQRGGRARDSLTEGPTDHARKEFMMPGNDKTSRDADTGAREEAERDARAFRAEVTRAADAIGGLPVVPDQLGDYEGWFKEAWKRVQLRSLSRTREEQLKLLDQLTQAYEKRVAFERAKGKFDRVSKEQKVEGRKLDVEGLKLDEEELALKRKIKAHEDALSAPASSARPKSHLAGVADELFETARTYEQGDPRRARYMKMGDALADAASRDELKRKLSPETLADPELQRILKQHGIRLD